MDARQNSLLHIIEELQLCPPSTPQNLVAKKAVEKFSYWAYSMLGTIGENKMYSLYFPVPYVYFKWGNGLDEFLFRMVAPEVCSYLWIEDPYLKIKASGNLTIKDLGFVEKCLRKLYARGYVADAG